MNNIVDNINKDNAKNLILDLRNNEGGSDIVGSVIASFLVHKITFILRKVF